MNDLKIINSVFKNNYGVEAYADFYCVSQEYITVNVINSTFINSTTELYELPSFLIEHASANIIGNRFENMFGSYNSETFELRSEYSKRKVIK